MCIIGDKVVKGLLEIGAVSINIETPYIWASGIKAPIYCDNRKTIGHYKLRRLIAEQLSERIKSAFPTVNLIGGTATAGIPHATSVADKLALPLVYFRSKPKAHGTNSVIEGHFQHGQKIVIVEDLISTGGSVLTCVEHARANGLDVLGVVSIVNYELAQAATNFETAHVAVASLVGFSEIYEALALPAAERSLIEAWRENPHETQIWANKLK
jgi:orotate phosphoribosyltransferase